MTNPSNPNNPTSPPPGEIMWNFAQVGSGLTQAATFWEHSVSAPQASSPWQEKPPEYYFEDNPDARDSFAVKRIQKKQYNQLQGLNPVWSELHEIKLVDQVWRNYYGEPWPGIQEWKHPPLDLDKLEPLSLRKYALQPFKIDYQTYNEIKLRLYNTVISIKGHPFWVKQVGQGPEGWRLGVWDGEKMYQVNYKDLTDLRTIPPMYITVASTGWLCRNPGRVYQQGMNRSNTAIRTITGTAGLYNFDPDGFVRAFRKRSKRVWNESFLDLMKTGDLTNVRLSDEVAVTTWKNDVLACYKGRALGHIEDNSIKVLDEDDLLQGWIERSARDVGLELRA